MPPPARQVPETFMFSGLYGLGGATNKRAQVEEKYLNV